jgi:hypothetical protein
MSTMSCQHFNYEQTEDLFKLTNLVYMQTISDFKPLTHLLT